MCPAPHQFAKKCRRRRARQRALLPTQGTARCRSWHSKVQCLDEWKLCTEFPSRRNLGQNWFGRRLSASALRQLDRFVLHREIPFAPRETVFVGTTISHRG